MSHPERPAADNPAKEPLPRSHKPFDAEIGDEDLLDIDSYPDKSDDDLMAEFIELPEKPE